MAGKAGMATGTEVARISVKVSPDTRQFRRDLKSDLEAIERSVTAKIDVEPDMRGFRREVASRTKGMRTSVKVDAVIDRNFFSQLSEKLQSLQAPTLGGGGVGLAVGVAGALALAAPLMGIITSAVLTLPGLLAAITAPIAAITLGMDGIKKAAEPIKSQFEDLKSVMSDAAETAFTPVLQHLADTVFPMLENQLPSVTQGLADMAQGVSNAFADPANAVKFEATIKRLGDMLSGIQPGFQSMTGGLIGLADQLSMKFPGITEWFNTTMASFDQWVAKLSADGTFGRAFDGLGDTLTIIGDAIVGMAGKGLDFMQDPEKVQSFATGLDAVGDAMVGIVESSNDFFGAIQKIKDNDWSFGDLFQGEAMTDGQGGGGLLYLDENGEVIRRDVEAIKESLSSIGPTAAEQKAALDNLFSPPAVSTQTGTNPFQDMLSTLETLPTEAPALPVPDTAAAEAKVTEYQGFVDSVTQQVRGSLSAATEGESLPAPDFTTFKAAWEELPEMVTTASQSMINEAAKVPPGMANSLAGMGGIGSAAGTALMGGILSGLQAGEAGVISYASGIADRIAAVKGPLPYDRVVLEPAGEALMEGLGKGMEHGFAPVLDQAKGLAGQIAEAFSNGGDPTSLLNGLDKGEIDRMEKVLALEEKRLASQSRALDYQAKVSGDDSLKSRADDIRLLKDQIGLQQDMLGLTQDYSDTLGDVSGGDNPLVDAASELLGAPVDFAKATAGQFMQDLGISGDGLISKGITEGIQYLFQIGSVDEALSIKDREDSKRARASVGR